MLDLLSPWRYAGKCIDPETGFIYFGERYYDPATLTWINPDPMEDADGPNLYAYVHNNPLFYVDPDGCFSLDWMKSGWARAGLLLADAALIASVIGSGLAGVAEGFLAGCSGGISGTAIDLAFDAVALCGEGGVAAACAGAEATAISYNSCKTVGQIAGALFSCTPSGKGAQVGIGLANVGIKGAKSAKTALQAAKVGSLAKKGGVATTNSVKTATIAGQKSQKVIHTFSNEVTEKIGSKVTGYTRHGLEQAIGRNEGRGTSLKGIIDALKNPTQVIDQMDRIKYVGNNVDVVVGKRGKIITVYGANRGHKIWEWGKYKK